MERILNPRIEGGDNYYGPTMKLKTIDPTTWAISAHYEEGWFSGNNLQEALKIMKSDNSTVIVSRTLAKEYGWELYDQIGVNFNSAARKLKIVGFFGPEPADNTNMPFQHHLQ